MNWRLWKLGLAVAFFCALADALGVYVAAESVIWGKVIAFAVIKGLGGAALWMKQHPAESISFDTTTTTKTENTTSGSGFTLLDMLVIIVFLSALTFGIWKIITTPP
jgi:hypothetical protein